MPGFLAFSFITLYKGMIFYCACGLECDFVPVEENRRICFCYCDLALQFFGFFRKIGALSLAIYTAIFYEIRGF